MKIWFEGSDEIACSLEHVKDSLENLGEHYVGVIRLMPGLSLVTTKGHFLDEFTTIPTGVKHRTVITEVTAPGFLGFFYRTFGSSNTGKALLKSYRGLLEQR